jgi:hypothetical protein
MTHLLTLSTEQVVLAARALAEPGLIRLISEIDDNGPVEDRMLDATLADFTQSQIHHALAAATEWDLLRNDQDDNHPDHELTARGEETAELYDSAARWARSHNYPSAHADFITRVHATLTLLSLGPDHRSEPRPGTPTVRHPDTAGASTGPGDAASLHQLRTQLHQWITSHSAPPLHTPAT